MRHATLFGRDHIEIGALASVAEGPAAIALSRGGAAKTYSYVDANEDAAAFSIGPDAVLVAVADGHDGDHGSAAAICSLRDDQAELWGGARGPVTSDDWALAAARAVAAANDAVLAEAARRRLPPAPTTLAFALWRRREGVVHAASVGDSHVFLATAGSARDVTDQVPVERRKRDFLGRGALSEEGAGAFVHVESVSARGLVALVLASDGLSERGIGVEDPPVEVHRALVLGGQAEREVRSLAVAKAVAAVALGAQVRQAAGDNIACGVVLLD